MKSNQTQKKYPSFTEEVERVIKRTKRSRTRGTDGITIDIIKWGGGGGEGGGGEGETNFSHLPNKQIQ